MTFDLSGLTAGDTAVTVTLKSVQHGRRRQYVRSATGVHTLYFQIPSDWNAATAPGPEGTALATVNITPALGTDTQNIQFSSPDLANAFNNAIGSKLYLGIKTDQEGAAPTEALRFSNPWRSPPTRLR